MKMGNEEEEISVEVREFDERRDSSKVEEVERKCEVGTKGKISLFTDLLGDPLCRIRHSPSFLMLVAELVVVRRRRGGSPRADAGEIIRREIVGMIRGCIKTVTCGTRNGNKNNGHDHPTFSLPVFTKLAYILGLRVSPSHRRMGIGLKLVGGIETWFRDNGAEYSYMATENDNVPSINLFTDKCGYSKFRTPSILVQPVVSHWVRVSRAVSITKLSPAEAESLYRRRFSTTEFFPGDIDAVLQNKLTLGTFLAVPRQDPTLTGSWAVMSVWNCKELWRLEVRGASRLTKGLAKTTRLVDRALPWLKVQSVLNVFRPFGLHFIYGLGREGPRAVNLVKALCGFAHNLARENGCGILATEVASQEPLRLGVPHWKKLSCAEDLWCIKRLRDYYSDDNSVGDWTKSPPPTSIFIDPREL